MHGQAQWEGIEVVWGCSLGMTIPEKQNKGANAASVAEDLCQWERGFQTGEGARPGEN